MFGLVVHVFKLHLLCCFVVLADFVVAVLFGNCWFVGLVGWFAGWCYDSVWGGCVGWLCGMLAVCGDFGGFALLPLAFRFACDRC